MKIESKFSILWTIVMFNIAFADILSLTLSNVLEESIEGPGSIKITQELMLVSAILIEIPIAMIFLSLVLKRKANRWANMVAAIVTILFVIGGGASHLHYLFFAAIEIVCLLLIIWYSWRWRSDEVEKKLTK